MYLLKNDCQFELKGVTFTVPENYYIDADNMDVNANTLLFESLDHHFQVSYKMEYHCKNVQKALSDLQLSLYDHCEPIDEIEHNGLTGYCSTFGDEREQYCVARFLVEETGNDCTAFEFTVLTYQGNIEQIKESAAFKQLFDRIQRTKQTV